MNIKDAYFAGLIDGEGSMGMYSRGVGLPRRLVVQVKMTCEDTCKALHSHYGGQLNPHPVPIGLKPQWLWRCTDNKALSVLEKIYPHLITKKRKAKLLIG